MPKYEKKITLGRDKDGKLIRKSVYGNTKAELEKKVFRARQEWLEKNANQPDTSMTFGTFVRRWYQQEKANKRIYTQLFYQNLINKYIIPNFDDLYFHELSLSDFQNLINENFEHPVTCKRIVDILKQIYSAAEDAEILTTKAPKFKRIVLPPIQKNEKRALTENEKQALFNTEFTDMEKAFLYILYYTGMRREEVIALEPSCFDFKNNSVEVRQTVTFTSNSTVLEKMAKNTYSLRKIPLPDACVPFLKEYVNSCDKWLFYRSRHKDMLLPYSSFQLFWQRIKEKLAKTAPEAMTLHPHLFRHNYATMLYYSEITVKKAAKLLGHANTQQIMQTYAHLDEEKENTVDKLNSVFG